MIKLFGWEIGWVGRLFLFCSLFLASANILDARSSVKNVATLDERISVARDSFEDIYYELFKGDDFFDVYYNNNLILRTKIDELFVQEGEIFLYLIDWLNKRNDRDSRYLLKKLSKYFYLEFYQILCHIDAQKNQNGTLLCMLKDIYKSKVVTPYGIEAPFRAVLSKLIVLIFMINWTNLPYEKKREAMAYTLHKMENQFLTINASLFEKKIPDETIKTFIQALQTHITKEPLIRPSMVKGVIITMLVIACLTGVVIVVWQYVIPNWPSIKGKMEEVRDNIFKPIGEGMGDGLKRSLLNDPVLLEQLGRRIVHGIATNPDLHNLSQQLGNGLIQGIARDHNNDAQPNPDLSVIADRLGSNTGGGLVKGILWAPFGLLGRGAQAVGRSAQYLWQHRPGHGAVPPPAAAPALAPAPVGGIVPPPPPPAPAPVQLPPPVPVAH